MTFAWPWILLLIPLPLLFKQQTGSDRNMAISLPPALNDAFKSLEPSAGKALQGRLAWLWLFWILALVALSQPSIPGDAVVQPATGRAMTLAIDLSGSMNREDFELNGRTDTRLAIVQESASQFIEARKGDRLALVLFGNEAFVASPLSFDLSAVSEQLRSAGIGMAGRSTAIGDALGLAIQTLKDDAASEKAIVLLSDGTNNAGRVEPESAAALAESLDIRIHTIAMGSKKRSADGYSTDPSADLDETTLQKIADFSGGLFFRATSSAELNEIYQTINDIEAFESSAPPVILQKDLRNPVLLLLLSLLIIGECWRQWKT